VTKTDLAWPLAWIALAVCSTAALAEPVTFRVQTPAARDVQVMGSFSAWRVPYPMRRAADGSWSVVLELQAGRYEYFYLVDGRPTVNPSAPSVADGLGGRNNVLIVPAAR